MRGRKGTAALVRRQWWRDRCCCWPAVRRWWRRPRSGSSAQWQPVPQSVAAQRAHHQPKDKGFEGSRTHRFRKRRFKTKLRKITREAWPQAVLPVSVKRQESWPVWQLLHETTLPALGNSFSSRLWQVMHPASLAAFLELSTPW